MQFVLRPQPYLHQWKAHVWCMFHSFKNISIALDAFHWSRASQAISVAQQSQERAAKEAGRAQVALADKAQTAVQHIQVCVCAERYRVQHLGKAFNKQPMSEQSDNV